MFVSLIKIITFRGLSTIWLCFLPIFSLEANEQETNIVNIEGFEKAKPILKENPRYPGGKLRKGEIGWTIVNYMVDPSGNTYDITVGDHHQETKVLTRQR